MSKEGHLVRGEAATALGGTGVCSIPRRQLLCVTHFHFQLYALDLVRQFLLCALPLTGAFVQRPSLILHASYGSSNVFPLQLMSLQDLSTSGMGGLHFSRRFFPTINALQVGRFGGPFDIVWFCGLSAASITRGALPSHPRSSVESETILFGGFGRFREFT